MDRYDYRILLQKILEEETQGAMLSSDTIYEITKVLNEDKPNISSVFGVGISEEREGALCVFVSDADTWKNEGYCADWYAEDDDTYEILNEVGFTERCDGVFSHSFDVEKSKNFMSRKNIIEKLTLIGLEYNKSFEEFILDV